MVGKSIDAGNQKSKITKLETDDGRGGFRGLKRHDFAHALLLIDHTMLFRLNKLEAERSATLLGEGGGREGVSATSSMKGHCSGAFSMLMELVNFLWASLCLQKGET